MKRGRLKPVWRPNGPLPGDQVWEADQMISKEACGLAIATLTAALNERDAEILRLRGLLREAHLALSFMPDPTRKLLDLRYRVREALEE